MIHDNVMVACARWETDSIAEWLAFHRHIGFDHAYLYCNDEEPTELFQAVLPFVQTENPFVTFYHFGLQGQQAQMYSHFIQNHLQDCQRFMCFDIDEFLLFRNCANLREFLSDYANKDAVHFHSVNAGHNNHRTRPKGFAIRNYTLRAAGASPFTKSIIKSSAVDVQKLRFSIGSAWWHNCEVILKEEADIVDVSGKNMRSYYYDLEKKWPSIAASHEFHARILSTGFIYHIGMKSEEDLLRRFERGVSGDFSAQTVWKECQERGEDYVREVLRTNNAVEEKRLVEMLDEIVQPAFGRQIVKAPPGQNFAAGMPATQSSVCEWSHHQDPRLDAAGVVSGRPAGRWSHHTALEETPWWTVDLGEMREIREIHVYNRVDNMHDRLRNLVFHGSLDGQTWHLLHIKHDDLPFGGVDGNMFIWKPPEPIWFRHLQVSGIGRCVLDMDQVALY